MESCSVGTIMEEGVGAVMKVEERLYNGDVSMLCWYDTIRGFVIVIGTLFVFDIIIGYH